MEGPIIEVSHLPAAASFYATITQALGIQYLSASPQRLHFGLVAPQGPKLVFTLQQSAVFPPRPSHITLLAQSPAAVSLFYKKSLLANPTNTSQSFAGEGDEECTARTRDLDGNMLEAVYTTRRRPIVETASTAKEARRVLEWQQEVARSVAADSSPSPSRSPSSASGSIIRDSRPPITTYRRAESYPSPVKSYPSPVSQQSGDRPMRLVRKDTITTEHYRRNDEEKRSRSGSFTGKLIAGTLLGAAAGAAVTYALHSDSPPRPVRRSTYDTPSPSSNSYNPVVERIPARSVRSYVQEPQYVTQYSAPPMARIEERERRSTRERSRSETGSQYERPVTRRTRSPGYSGSHVSHRSHRSDERSSYHGKKADSYVSHRTESSRDKVQYITARVVPAEDRERRSVVSARHVPLPHSVVGGRGYAASVAPSDSVSSVGIKRERERLRDRMRERW